MNISKIFISAIVLLLSSSVFGQTQVPNTFQSGQPARASEVNENFNAVVQGIQSLESSVQVGFEGLSEDNARLDGLEYMLVNLEGAVRALGQEYAVCSVRNTSACHGLLGQKDLALLTSILFWDIYIVTDPATINSVFALPYEKNIGISTDPTDDLVKLIFGRQANFTRGAGAPANAEVLVDSCEDPTVYLVPTGEPKTGGLGVDNGKTYVGDNAANPVTVDVTGGIYGLIHDYTNGFPDNYAFGPPQLCFPVSDRQGLYDSYPLIFREDTSTWGEEWSLTADDPLNP
jgi:hypothetical protein